MSTLNEFTSSAVGVRRLLLSVTLLCGVSGCLSDPLSAKRGVAGDPQADQSSVSNERTEVPVAQSYDTPKVKGRNAQDFASAVAAIKTGDLAQAERLLRSVTASQPELAGPWVNLGQVYLQLGQEEEARLAFRKAIAANPANCAAYNQLGVLSRQMGDFTAAENHYLKCLSADPASADVYLNLGILYELYLGRLGDALSAYRQYQTLTVQPDRKVAGWVLDLERRTDR